MEILQVPEQFTLLQQLEMSLNIKPQVREKLAKIPNVLSVSTEVSVTLHVNTTVPYEMRGVDGVLDAIFKTEQALMEGFPNVEFDFNVSWETEPSPEEVKVDASA